MIVKVTRLRIIRDRSDRRNDRIACVDWVNENNQAGSSEIRINRRTGITFARAGEYGLHLDSLIESALAAGMPIEDETEEESPT